MLVFDEKEHAMNELEKTETRQPIGQPVPTPSPEGSEPLSRRAKIIGCVAMVLIALLSFFPLATLASSPDTHAGTIVALDKKAADVTALVGASTAASVATSFFPGGSGISGKLLDIAANLGIVLAAIYLEKYLLTILGLAACRIVVPLACGLGVVLLLARLGESTRARIHGLVLRLVLLAVAMVALVPASVGVSGLIESTFNYDASAVAEQVNQGAEAVGEQSEQAETSGSSSSSNHDSGESNPLSDFANWLGGIGQGVADAATGAASALMNGANSVLDWAKGAIATLVESFAVMIVTDCVIPILVLLFFVWLINFLLGLNIPLPSGPVRGLRGRAK